MLKYHIQTIEVGSGGAADITFNNIPQDYDDLYLVYSLRNSTDTNHLTVSLNGSTSNFTLRELQGEGSGTPSSASRTDSLMRITVDRSSFTANTFSSAQMYFPNYISSTNKSFSLDGATENNAILSYQTLIAGLWSNTSAINSIALTSPANFVQYSSASLYGIKYGVDGDVEAAADGGAITQSGGYTIHTFTSSGTFVANRDMDVEYLVVAGGGGGASTGSGQNGGGGGGAGGYRTSVFGATSGGNTAAEPFLRVSAGQSYSVAVGAGGASGTAGSPVAGSSGGPSSFGSIISIGGGGGGRSLGTGGLSGGSGGGGSGTSTAGTGGSAVSGQGFAGGAGGDSEGGGGGGAGQIGEAARNGSVRAGNGGNGLSSTITGSAVTRAGGGGGGTYNVGSNGTGGTGGGGNGGNPATAGSTNTGSGGGGAQGNTSATGGAGGSGIVIIRYPTPA